MIDDFAFFFFINLSGFYHSSNLNFSEESSDGPARRASFLLPLPEVFVSDSIDFVNNDEAE